MKKFILFALFAFMFQSIIGSVGFKAEAAGNTNINFEAADSQKTTDTTIRFNSEGKLKILHIADPHLDNDRYFDASIWVIAEACDQGQRSEGIHEGLPINR